MSLVRKGVMAGISWILLVLSVTMALFPSNVELASKVIFVYTFQFQFQINNNIIISLYSGACVTFVNQSGDASLYNGFSWCHTPLCFFHEALLSTTWVEKRNCRPRGCSFGRILQLFTSIPDCDWSVRLFCFILRRKELKFRLRFYLPLTQNGMLPFESKCKNISTLYLSFWNTGLNHTNFQIVMIS